MKNSVQGRISPQRISRIISILGITLLPFISATLLCLSQNTLMHKLYIPISENYGWNDEVFYYKQVEAIKDFNMPLGYFGYNESHAVLGNMGAWSPVCYLFYAIFAKLFDWNYVSPIWCNLLLLTIAMFILSFRVKFTTKQSIILAGCYLTYIPLTRLSLSCMSDVSVSFLVICYCAVWLSKKQEEHCGVSGTTAMFSKGEIAVMYLISAILTLMKPYYILLMVPLGYQSYKRTGKKRSYVLWIGLMLGTFFLYFGISYYFCASYFGSSIGMPWLEYILLYPVNGIINMIYIGLHSTREFLVSGWKDGILGNEMNGGVKAAYLFIVFYFGWNVLQNRKQSKERNKWLGWLLCFLMLFLAQIYLYTAAEAWRQYIGFTLIGILFIIVFETDSKWSIAIVITLFTIFILGGAGGNETLPVREWDYMVDMGQKEALLQENLLIEQNVDPWDNTIIWDYVNTDSSWQDMYAVPSGMGINLCREVYLLENFENLQSKYLLTSIGSSVDILCEESQKEILVEFNGNRLYILR